MSRHERRRAASAQRQDAGERAAKQETSAIGSAVVPAELLDALPAEQSAFDYSVLDAETAKRVQRAAEQIRQYGKRIGQHIIYIGINLVGVKERLGHGHFGPWLEAEFGWSERSAQRYMQAATVFQGEKSDIVAVLPPTTIYKLSAPSTPAPVREAVVERLEKGERIAPAEIDDMVTAARERDRPKKAPVAKQESRQPEPVTPAERLAAYRKNLGQVTPQSVTMDAIYDAILILSSTQNPEAVIAHFWGDDPIARDQGFLLDEKLQRAAAWMAELHQLWACKRAESEE